MRAATLNPNQDETLLRTLADCIRCGEHPQSTAILKKARVVDAEGFRGWTAQQVAQHLRRYDRTTNKTSGRKLHGRMTLEDL